MSTVRSTLPPRRHWSDLPMRPVTTQPIVGVMLKRWVTVLASNSLSCSRVIRRDQERERDSSRVSTSWSKQAFKAVWLFDAREPSSG